ncbi:hypothetical protein J1N35_023811 [Gossypium stocksii]|uniref:Uncharacterized protein n=1 Tax=Gossypium stocksii TaxID=47602 RepID=A0A9D3VIQ9_9ROSI|nr:hypothetical protein J1N35_023811 [Gossypium stocksii]
MKQHGVSMQEAYNEFYKQINNACKDINEECLKPTAAAPRSALNRILNLARVMDLFHNGEDAYTHVGDAAKTSINSLLIDSRIQSSNELELTFEKYILKYQHLHGIYSFILGPRVVSSFVK